MTSETRQCQSCRDQFIIEPEDFQFYEKIKVPPPTFCPECRLIRRMTFQNERTLYRRKCDLCGNPIIAIFPENADRPVYCQPCWWSDKWDATTYGRDVDFSRPFFEQLDELFHEVPDFGPQTMHASNVNSTYCNIASYLKNCYLLFNSDYDEDCQYSTCLEQSKNCVDLYLAGLSEFCYMSMNLWKCFRIFFSVDCEECIDIWFSKDLRSCSNCFGCVNLRNKQYYIFNQPYTKEEYRKKMAEWNTGSYRTTQELSKKARDLHNRYPRKYMTGVQNANVSGDYVFQSKNTFLSYKAVGAEDSKYCQFLIIGGTKDSYDFTMWGSNASRIYECMGAGNNQDNIRFCYDSWNEAHDIQYSWHILARNSDLFGCMALRNKQYCILNKQYTREEYEALVPKIIAHMNEMPYISAKRHASSDMKNGGADGGQIVYKYGEFFPPEMSAYAYNETLAQKHFPLTKEEAIAKGYRWRDQEPRTYTIDCEAKDLPDSIQEVDDSILGKTIGCTTSSDALRGRSPDPQASGCTTGFKLTSEELAFYRKLNLPLPRQCHNCRHYSLVQQRNPIRFYRGTCRCAGTQSENGAYTNTAMHMHGSEHCLNEFETSYAPDAPEIVYCERCYQAEVA